MVKMAERTAEAELWKWHGKHQRMKWIAKNSKKWWGWYIRQQ